MLRSELILSVQRLIQTVEKSRAEEAVITGDISARFFAFYTFARVYENSSPADKHLLRILDLEPLLDLRWWAEVFDNDDRPGRPDRPDRSDRPDRPRGPSTRAEMHNNLAFATQKLPLIVQILQPTVDEEEKTLAQIKLLLPESEDQTSSPMRVILAIESIVLIYVAICKLHNEEENTLALRRCDSGSDKSFDFTGLPQIIDQVKSIIFGIVDRVIFFREVKYAERVKRVAESLPVLDQIGQMVENKRLSPEQAELLRRNLINGATKFLETGSLIPEVNNPSRYETSSLIQPSPKLLLEGPSKGTADGLSKERSDNLSEHTRDNAKKTRRKRASSPPAQRRFSVRDINEFLSSDISLSEEERQQLSNLINKSSREDQDGG